VRSIPLAPGAELWRAGEVQAPACDFDSEGGRRIQSGHPSLTVSKRRIRGILGSLFNGGKGFLEIGFPKANVLNPTFLVEGEYADFSVFTR